MKWKMLKQIGFVGFQCLNPSRLPTRDCENDVEKLKNKSKILDTCFVKGSNLIFSNSDKKSFSFASATVPNLRPSPRFSMFSAGEASLI